MFTERERNTKESFSYYLGVYVYMDSWGLGISVYECVEASGDIRWLSLSHSTLLSETGSLPAWLRQGLSLLHVERAIGWTSWPASGTVQSPSLCCGYSCLTLCPARDPRAGEQHFMLVKQACLPYLLLTSLPTGLLSSELATGFYLKIRPDSPLCVL